MTSSDPPYRPTPQTVEPGVSSGAAGDSAASTLSFGAGQSDDKAIVNAFITSGAREHVKNDPRASALIGLRAKILRR
jgi:hypothetical protein